MEERIWEEHNNVQQLNDYIKEDSMRYDNVVED